VAKVLHWFEDTLPVDMFARVHRSHLVNRMFVESVNGKHTEKLLLLNGEIITISRRKKSLFN
jgi:DNA-binding LytR/AlgR family response regulator